MELRQPALRFRPRIWILVLALLLGLAGRAEPPSFGPVTPGEGARGDWAVWQGTGLGAVQEVTLGGDVCRFHVPDAGTSLSFQVPGSARPGPRFLKVKYRTAAQAQPLERLAERPFLVLADRPGEVPEVTSVRPFQVRGGEEVTLAGTHLDRATEVCLGERACAILEQTPGRLRFRVPAEAVTGELRLQPRQEGDPRRIIILPPVVTSVEPLSGPPGTRVTCRGEGLRHVRRVRLGEVELDFHVVDDHTLHLRIPDAALTRAFTFEAVNGKTASPPERFHVLALPRPTPVILDFRPREAREGEEVTLEGLHLENVLAVRVGGTWTPARHPGRGRVAFTVPPGAGSGPLRITYPLSAPGATEWTESAESLRVIPPGPLLYRVDPPRGPAGSPVVITGAHLQELEGVTFGETPAQVLRTEPGELWVTAPALREAAAITVVTRSGRVQWAEPFVPEPGGPPAVTIAALYVTQGIQRLDGSVPLVAGKAGLLRVFLRADRANALRPSVRVRIRTEAGETVRVIPAPGPAIPTLVDEDRLSGSWNLPLPDLQPGTTLLADLVPGQGEPPMAARFPADGQPLALEVRVAPPLRITFLPVRLTRTPGRPVGDVRPDNLETWLGLLRKLFPVAQVDAQVGPVWETPESFLTAASVSRALDALDGYRRANLGAGRICCGVFPRPAQGTEQGQALSQAGTRTWTVLVQDQDLVPEQDDDCAKLAAHEFGHLFGLRHAKGLRGANEETVDPDFPDPEGRIQASGFDLEQMRPLRPGDWYDIMGYWHRLWWISPYNYELILRALTAPPAQAQPAPETDVS